MKILLREIQKDADLEAARKELAETGYKYMAETSPEAPESIFKKPRLPDYNPADSIQKIINAIKSVNCAICSKGAGIMVAKKELVKYKNWMESA